MCRVASRAVSFALANASRISTVTTTVTMCSCVSPRDLALFPTRDRPMTLACSRECERSSPERAHARTFEQLPSSSSSSALASGALDDASGSREAWSAYGVANASGANASALDALATHERARARAGERVRASERDESNDGGSGEGERGSRSRRRATKRRSEARDGGDEVDRGERRVRREKVELEGKRTTVRRANAKRTTGGTTGKASAKDAPATSKTTARGDGREKPSSEGKASKKTAKGDGREKPSSEGKEENASVRVLLSSGFSERQRRELMRKISSLGGRTTDSLQEFDVFITEPPLQRTKNVMAASILRRPICSTSWVEKSAKAKSFAPYAPHVVRDKKFEAAHQFTPPDGSVAGWTNRNCFKSKTFCVMNDPKHPCTPSNIDEHIRDLLLIAGASPTTRRDADVVVLISSVPPALGDVDDARVFSHHDVFEAFLTGNLAHR